MGNFIRERPEGRDLVQLVYAYEKFVPSRIMVNNFVVITCEGKKESVLCVERVLLLFCLNSQTGSLRTNDVFLQYMKCTPAKDEVDQDLG